MRKILKDLKVILVNAVSHAEMEGIVDSSEDGVLDFLDTDPTSISVRCDVQHFVRISGENDNAAYENIEIYHNEVSLGKASSLLASKRNNMVPILSYTDEIIALYSNKNGRSLSTVNYGLCF